MRVLLQICWIFSEHFFPKNTSERLLLTTASTSNEGSLVLKLQKKKKISKQKINETKIKIRGFKKKAKIRNQEQKKQL